MKISIIGPGSMGIVLSYFLGRCNEVTLVSKREKVEVYKKGLTVIDKGEEKDFDVEVSSSIPPSEIVIVAVKSYDLRSVIRQYSLRGNVMFIQNGISHRNMEQEGIRKIYAVTTWGAKKISPTVVELTGQGYFRVGSDDGKIDLSFMNQSGINAEWIDDIDKEIYRKVAINATINPLTSLFNVKNGELIKNRNLWIIATKVISELQSLFTDMGYDLDIIRNVKETCDVTQYNISSMLQDIMMKRRTEIDSITGEILKLGKIHGIKMTANEVLYNSILYLEKNERKGS